METTRAPKGTVQSAILPVRALVVALRPRQWTKNALLFAALFFSFNQLWSFSDLHQVGILLGRVVAGFFLFCALSGATYLANDLADLERDRAHPRKRNRPLASGRLPVLTALVALVLLGLGGLVGSFLLSISFGLVALGYVVLQAAYSASLKHMVILDVMALATGFLLRAVAGAVVIAAPISPWLYVCTALGSLFIGFGKRRNEMALQGEGNTSTRSSLSSYTLPLLDQLIGIVATATLIAYTLYTFTAEALPANHAMMLTIPFVAYGLFRYLYLIYRQNLGESPEEILLTDRPLLADVLLWVATVGAVFLFLRG